MGCHCPDKLMSLKQQARLRSLRARAKHNLQEKWQEKCPGPSTRGHAECVHPANPPSGEQNLYPCNHMHTAQTHAIPQGLRLEAPIEHSGGLIPPAGRDSWFFCTGRDSWFFCSARAKDMAGMRKRKRWPRSVPTDGAVSGPPLSRYGSTSAARGFATASYLPCPPQGWLLDGRDSGRRPPGQERGHPC